MSMWDDIIGGLSDFGSSIVDGLDYVTGLDLNSNGNPSGTAWGDISSLFDGPAINLGNSSGAPANGSGTGGGLLGSYSFDPENTMGFMTGGGTGSSPPSAFGAIGDGATSSGSGALWDAASSVAKGVMEFAGSKGGSALLGAGLTAWGASAKANADKRTAKMTLEATQAENAANRQHQLDTLRLQDSINDENLAAQRGYSLEDEARLRGYALEDRDSERAWQQQMLETKFGYDKDLLNIRNSYSSTSTQAARPQNTYSSTSRGIRFRSGG